jgi:hypothetical protein
MEEGLLLGIGGVCVCVVREFAERVVGRERGRELGQWPPVSK